MFYHTYSECTCWQISECKFTIWVTQSIRFFKAAIKGSYFYHYSGTFRNNRFSSYFITSHLANDASFGIV